MAITVAERFKIASADFGDPSARLFPCRNQTELDSAATLYGKAKDPAAVKKRLIEIAKRKGLDIPESWKTK